MMLETLVTLCFGGFSRPLPSPAIEKSASMFGRIYGQKLAIVARARGRDAACAREALRGGSALGGSLPAVAGAIP